MPALLPLAFASPPAPAGLFAGFELIGIDGLIVLATLAVGIATVLSVLAGQEQPTRPDVPEPPPDFEPSLDEALTLAAASEAVPAGLTEEADPLIASAPPPVEPVPVDPSPVVPAPARDVRPFRSLNLRVERIRARLTTFSGGGLALAAGLTLLFLGQKLFTREIPPGLSLWIWLAGIALIVACGFAAGALQFDPGTSLRPLDRPNWQRWRVWGPACVTILAAVAVWRGQSNRDPQQQHWDILVIWVVSILAVLVTAWQASGGGRDSAWISAHRTDILIAGLLGLATVPLVFWRLGTHPWVLNGDEALFTTSARAVLDGQIKDPFGTGALSHPSLYFFAQAAAMAIFGDNVFGARSLSALFGVGAVMAAYILTLQLTGKRTTATAAAVLLATIHIHLYWARNGLNNGSSVFFALLALILILHCLGRGGAGALAVTGVVIGVAQYSYFGARVLPIVAVLAIAYAALRTPGAASGQARVELATGRLLWMLAGFAVSILPLYVHYRQFPDEFNARSNDISVFGGDFLPNEAIVLGTSETGVLWQHFVRVAMLPFRSHPAGHYRGEPPFVGWPLAILGAIGLGTALILAIRPRWIAPVACYWAVVAGAAITIDPTQTNRFVIASGLLCVFAAVGLETLATPLIRTLRIPRQIVLSVAAIAVLLSSAWSVDFYFKDDNQVAMYSDPNTQIADALAHEIVEIDPTATVYFMGAPRMFYGGFANIRFRLPDATGIDIDEPLTSRSDKLPLDGVTIFATVPERAGELRIVRRWYPGGTDIERRSDKVGELFSMYVVDPAMLQQQPAATPPPATLVPVSTATRTPTATPSASATPPSTATLVPSPVSTSTPIPSPSPAATVALDQPLVIVAPANAASPVASPVASPLASPVASPAASPVASPSP